MLHHMLLLIPFSFLYLFLFYTFLSFHSFILSFYRVLYNLYLNPNLLKILSNYIYTIPKVITLHIYILTYFYLFLLLFLFSFIHFYLLYFSFMHFHHTFLLFLHIVLLCLNWSYYIWLFHTTILIVNIASCQATVLYCAILYLVIINFIGSSFKLLCNSALLCHYCAIVNHLLICILL